jgi:hypothetical protein
MAYQFVGEDEHSYTIHDGADEFRVAKSALGDLVGERIKGLPKFCSGGAVKMAEGGEVPTPDADAILAGTWKPGPESMAVPGVPGIDPSGVAAEPGQAPVAVPSPMDLRNAIFPGGAPTAPLAPSPSGGISDYEKLIAGASSPRPGPVQSQGGGFMNPMGGFLGALNASEREARTGIGHEKEAAQQAAGEQTRSLDAFTKAMQDRDRMFNESMGQINKEHDFIVNDIKSWKLDPNRMWNSRSAGEKVMASIGMILGGIGSGLTGQPNAALQVVQAQIDRDVDAQKAQLGKAETLLSANFRKSGNLQMAEQMTRSQLAAGVEGQLKAAAARSGSLAAQAHAEQASAQLRLQYAQTRMSIAQAQAMFGLMQGAGGGGGFVPSQAKPPIPGGFNPEHIAKWVEETNARTYEGPNGAKIAAYSPEAAQNARQRMVGVNAAEATVNRLRELGAQGATLPASDAAKAYERNRHVAAVEIARAMVGAAPSEQQIKEAEGLLPGNWEQALRTDAFGPAFDAMRNTRNSIWTTFSGIDPKYHLPRQARK